MIVRLMQGHTNSIIAANTGVHPRVISNKYLNSKNKTQYKNLLYNLK